MKATHLCMAVAVAAMALSATALEPIKLGEKATLKITGEERARWEARDDADFKGFKDDSNNFVGNRFRLQFALDLGTHVSLVAQGQDSRHWDADLASTKIRDGYDELHQAYIEFKKVGVEGLSFRIGRQEINYGDQRLVGAFGWSNVGRSFDAVKVRYATKAFFVEALAADARTRPQVPDRESQSLWGVYGGFLQNHPKVQVELYGLVKEDDARIAGETPLVKDDTRIATYGGRVTFKPAKPLAVVLETAFQDGHKGPDDHRADAQALKATYTFAGELAPYVGAEVDRATGDHNPADRKSGSFDNLFPTNHDKYGLMDYQNWSNLEAFSLNAGFQPAKWVGLRAELHHFNLESAKGAWTAAGGASLGRDASGVSGRSAGWEWDLLAKGSVPKIKNLSWLAGLSEYHPGSYAEKVRGGDTSRYAYIQVGLTF